MNYLLPFRFARCRHVFVGALLFLGAVSTTFATTPETTSQIQEKSAAAAEDREALLARLTKILNYGSEIGGYRKPSKAEAVIALGLIGDERSVPVLIDHLQNEENNQLRVQIVRALGWIGSDKAVPALEQALQDKYPYVRKQAAEVLKGMTDRDYEYDKTGLPDLGSLRARPLSPESGVPTVADAERLDAIVKEVAIRRERRVAAAGGAVAPKKKLTEPVDMNLKNVSVGTLVETYSDLSGKMVLVSPKASAISLSCKVEKTTRAEALAALQKSLKEAGVQIVEFESGVVAFVPTNSTGTADTSEKP